MIIYSLIQKSQLEGGQRIDPEYYQPEFLQIAKILQSLPHKKLEEISENLISFGAYDLTNYIEWTDKGIPFIEANNIKEGFIDYDGVRRISEKSDEILKKSRVREGQVLLAMSGSVGNTAIAQQIPSKLNSNQDIVKITLKKDFSPYFIATFLNSRYGRKQILRLPVGSVQQHIFLWQTKTILIPTLSPLFVIEIENQYKQALHEAEQSKLDFEKAEKLLLQELDLTDFQIPEDVSFEINFSGVQNAHRIDADYFQPKYEKLVSKLRNKDGKPLFSVIKNVPANFNPSLKSDESFKYVELSNINASIGTIDGYSVMLGKEAPGRAKRILSTGDVIVSSVEGSLEKVALVDEKQKGYLASTGFFQFRSDVILPEVLLVLAKSMIFHMQLEKETAGTILTAVPKEAIKNIFVPVLSMGIQQKIADLVRKSHEAHKKSKTLLEEAKKKVEEMIEKTL